MISLKDIAIKVLCDEGFKLQKWYSNVPALEEKELTNETDQTFTKQQLGVNQMEKRIKIF